MNSFIETLNQWGGNFLSFAWPALWQSSLLIAVLFALDFLLRRKLRASIRYALWLVVLVKLCLPPTLALPTSPAWWLRKIPPPAVVKSEARFTVTYDDTPLPQIPQIPPPVFTPPKPAMTLAAWLLMLSASVSNVLLFWLLARWRQIARQVRRAETSSRLTAIGNEAQGFLGLKMKVSVKLTTNSMSPAVCGLICPTILIPQSLVENFSDEQLRAVLLHELIHLRRRDVWMNFLQALLQIFYWWHPLVWLANARIRRVREEAVDDAVMLALRDEAESYAPTLLEVAKLALNRPLAGLGLVGILESRHALRQRIERLINFSAPRKAGLTFLSLCGIFLFSAVALPMGAGPSSTDDQSDLPSPKISPAPKKTPIKQVLITSHFYWVSSGRAEKIMPELKLIFSANDLIWKVSPQKFNQVADSLRSSTLSEFAAPRVVTLNHETATVSVSKGTNGIYITCTPTITNDFVHLAIHGTVNEGSIREQFDANSTLENRGGFVIRAKSADEIAESNLVVLVGVQIDPTNFSREISQDKTEQLVQDGKLLYEMGKLEEAQAKLDEALKLDPDSESAFYYKNLIRQARLIYTGSGRAEIMNKLNSYRLSVSYNPAVPLREVIRDLRQKIQAMDPTKKPMNININNSPLGGATTIDPNPLAGNPGGGGGEPTDIGSYLIKLNLKDVRVADVLDAICSVANDPNHPDERIKYSIMDYGIVFSLKDQSPALFERTFKVDKTAFIPALQKATGLQTTNVSTMARSFFSKLGVDLDSPTGKSVIFNDRLGLLFARATAPDLDTIERAIEMLNSAENKLEPDRMVQDAKLDYEMGKLDEAEAKLKMILALDSSNEAAYYYLDLVDKARLAPKQPPLMILTNWDVSPIPIKKIDANDKQFDQRISTIGFEDSAATNLLTRTFKVDLATLRAGLEGVLSSHFGSQMPTATNISTLSPTEIAREFFAGLGLNWQQPPGKSIVYNDQSGTLVVTATKEDLDAIERIIQVINQVVTPQIHIKARFVEVTQNNSESLGFDWYLGQFNASNNVAGKGGGSPSPAVPVSAANPLGGFPGNTTSSTGGLQNSAPAMASLTGILTDSNFRVVLHALQQRSGSETLGESEGTTTSGRQMQMRATKIINVITNFTLQVTATNSRISPQSEPVEIGPVLDVIPYVLSDDYTINLTAIPSLTEFLGYDTTTNSTADFNVAGERTNVPVVLPRFDVRQASANVNLWDGQTLVFGILRGEVTVGGKKVDAKQESVEDKVSAKRDVEDKELLVFITVNLVDPAGNRIHSDDELPFANNGIPAQPKH